MTPKAHPHACITILNGGRVYGLLFSGGERKKKDWGVGWFMVGLWRRDIPFKAYAKEVGMVVVMMMMTESGREK